ncbi:MAG: winged helix DNA-binding domain-containing protein [Chloroflexi bacterium]|nr:winged helix DNA-binding domain-containing protein [Chloroflexota bacterium]
MQRGSEIITAALADGQHLTRTDLFMILEANGISTAGQRGFYLLQRAGLERRVFQGAMRGSVTTFMALPPGSTLSKEDVLAELARRYFTSRGPATLADFIHWSGLLTSEARAGLESVKAALIEEKIDGQSYWCAPETPPPPPRSLYLLPGFDEYYLGYKDRSAVLDMRFANAICPGGNGVFAPTTVSGGQIIGTWKRIVKKKAVEMTFAPFRPLRPDEIPALSAAAQRFGAFLGLEARVKSATD